MNNIILAHSNNHVTADSRMVAEHFRRDHRNVLAAVDELVRGMLENQQTPQDYFIESHYIHEQNGQVYRFFMLTRDGFSLLVMGFTGREALEWKLKYIAAFNEFEKAATKPMSHLEILAESAKALVEHDRRLSLVEKKQDVVIEALTPPASNDWEGDINSKVRMICKHRDLNYQAYWQELYIRLEATTRIDLSARKNNKIKRMKEVGCKSKEYNAVSKLSIIAEDRQLKQIFENIIREEVAKLALFEAGGEAS